MKNKEMYYEDRDSIAVSLAKVIEEVMRRELTDEEYEYIFNKFDEEIEPFTMGHWRNYN